MMMVMILHIYVVNMHIWYIDIQICKYIRVLKAIKALAAMKELVEETHITTHATHFSFEIHHSCFLS